MRRRNLMALFGRRGCRSFGAAVTEQARAAGYWNMPGTHAQRAGHGYGGGYHAPLILGPDQLRWLGAGERGAIALCAVAVLWLRKLRRLRADGRGDEFDGERCADRAQCRTDAGRSVRKAASPARDARHVPKLTSRPVAEPTRPLFDPPVQQ